MRIALLEGSNHKVEEDIEALPRHPQRIRKTPSEASP
jgi:hypothetical protein